MLEHPDLTLKSFGNKQQIQRPVRRSSIDLSKFQIVMFASIGLSLLLATLVICHPEGHRWHEPKGHRWHRPLSTDRKTLISRTLFNDGQLTISLGRSPCPGINALANHDYLPRNGLNISLEQFITGVGEGYNFAPDVAIFAVATYQPFTTTGYNNTLHLNDLDHHASKLILLFIFPHPEYYSLAAPLMCYLSPR